MEWYYYLGAFILFWALRGTYYFFKLRETKRLKTKYLEYQTNESFEFSQHKPQILALFKLANVEDSRVTHMEEISWNQAYRHQISAFSNINSNRADIVTKIRIAFEETIGVFKHHIRQSFNPFFWIEFILQLPQKIISYIDINTPTSITKIIQVIYWIIMVLFGAHKIELINITSWF